MNQNQVKHSLFEMNKSCDEKKPFLEHLTVLSKKKKILKLPIFWSKEINSKKIIDKINKK